MSTIRDVAKLANVSTATVSRVLNNDTTYKMTEATKQHVWDAVTQLNYKSNLIAKAQRTNGSPSQQKSSVKIGCILSVTKDKYNDPYFMSILSGVDERLHKSGYELAFLRTVPELEDRNTLYSTFNEPVTGLILMEALNAATYEYIRKQVPFIVGIDTAHSDIDNIGYDHYDVATKAVQHLIEKGHTRIGFIGGNGLNDSIRGSLRYKGYYSTMHAAGLTVNPNWVINCQWDEAICIEGVNKLCKLEDRPTAIFAASDLMAMAALSSLYANGVNVPSEMAVIGISNIELSKYSNPPLTTLEIPTKEIGMVAVDLLLARINGDNLLPKKVILPTALILRSST
jgi:LacI family transcriptional regulator